MATIIPENENSNTGVNIAPPNRWTFSIIINNISFQFIFDLFVYTYTISLLDSVYNAFIQGWETFTDIVKKYQVLGNFPHIDNKKAPAQLPMLLMFALISIDSLRPVSYSIYGQQEFVISFLLICKRRYSSSH